MLARQELEQIDQLEPGRLPLDQHLTRRHRVIRFDVIAGAILDAIFQQGDPPAGREGSAHPGQHGLGIRHLVIDVGQEDPVDLAGGELRIIDLTQDRHDAGDAVALS